MDWLDSSQVCYCDTDSVIFIYDETNPDHKNPYIHETPDGLEFGKGLGQWEDEFDGVDYIIELVIAGAKSYAFETAYGCTKKGKVVVKQKGITLDRANDNVVNLDTLRKMVLDDADLMQNPQYEYVLDKRKKTMTKKVKVVAKIESEKRFQFKWNTQSKDIITKYISKSIKSTVKEKRTIDGFETLPFGFEHKI